MQKLSEEEIEKIKIIFREWIRTNFNKNNGIKIRKPVFSEASLKVIPKNLKRVQI